MESPPPAVFHDKAKITQQGDLLLKLQIRLQYHILSMNKNKMRRLLRPTAPDSGFQVCQPQNPQGKYSKSLVVMDTSAKKNNFTTPDTFLPKT